MYAVDPGRVETEWLHRCHPSFPHIGQGGAKMISSLHARNVFDAGAFNGPVGKRYAATAASVRDT